MFKVVAILAIVGYVAAVTPQDLLNQQAQIATQNAINHNGAVRNAVLQSAQGLGYSAVVPSVYSAGVVPAVYSAGVVPSVYHAGVVPTVYGAELIPSNGPVSVRDAVALNNQIATQNALNSQQYLRHAGVLVR